jgi:phenylacetate-CoA ligase
VGRHEFSEIESQLESQDRSEVEAWQLARTIDQTKWVSRSRYWADAISRSGLSEASLTMPDDFLGFPYLDKDSYKSDMTQSPPYGGFLCRALGEIEQEGAHLFRTTGTTGRQTSIIKSQSDLRDFARCGARNLAVAGAQPGDYVFMTFPYSMWTAAWGYYNGASLVGTTIIPAGAPMPTEMRIDLLNEYRPRVMVCTPSYALALAEAARSAGTDPADAGVEIVMVGGEPVSTARRKRIEEAWGVPGGVRNFSGISEVAGVYLGAECEAQQGMHVYEDVLRCDVVVPGESEWASPETGGELVVTSLVETALALNYRFRTGDLVYFTDEPCSCGRTSRRLLSIETRLDDMRKIRGINVWASAIEELLHSVDGVGDEFELVLERKGDLDEVTVRVEPRADLAAERYAAVSEQAESLLIRQLGIRLPVEVVPPGSLPRYELKAKRWVDRRMKD